MTNSNQETTNPIVIYHIEGRRSFRVIWLCEELGLSYRLVFKKGDILGSMVDIRKTFPLMPMCPVVQIGDQFLVESGAILEVLASRYGERRFIPTVNSEDYPHHEQWMHFAEATVMSRLSVNLFTALAMGVPVNMLPDGYRSGIDPIDAAKMAGPLQTFTFIEDYLSKYDYFGGSQFSAADIMMHYSLRGAKLMGGIETADYPHIEKWRLAVESRAAYERTVAAACPDGMNEYMLPEGHPLPFEPVQPLSRISRVKYKFKLLGTFLTR